MTELFARKSATRGRDRAQHAVSKSASKVAKGAMHTLPIVLVGTIAMSLNMTAPLDTTNLKHDDKPKDSNEQLRNVIATAMNAAANERAQSGTPATSALGAPAVAATTTAPASYRVLSGDTISSIASSYGLSTASVLALNGLGWNSLIFPGQVLQLTNNPAAPTSTIAPPATATPSATSQAEYTITQGDTVSAIASRFGVSTQAILTANQLGWSTIIYPGQTIVIPGTAEPAEADSVTPPAIAPPADAPSGDAPPVVAPPVVDIAPVSDVTPIFEAPTAGPHSSSYLITSGDTLTSIAVAFGVSVQAILDANGLNHSSTIFAGRALDIPQITNAPASVGTMVTPLTAEMATNARTIIDVGTSLGVSDYGLVVALSAAMQESTLRNLNYGDLDSLGLFQQRPSTGWGTPTQVTDPEYASKLFFGGPNNPNSDNTRGLLDIPGWQSMTVTQAAQAVQISGYPDAYAKWETSARAWLSQLR